MDYQIKRLIYLFIAGVIAYIFLTIRNRSKRTNIITKKKMDLPAETWFYSKLVDIELEKENYKKIKKNYITYVTKKYKINYKIVTDTDLLNILEQNETDTYVSKFQKSLLKEINSIKDEDKETVIEYVKSIKFNFNQDNLKEWLKKYHEDDCRNC